MCKFFHKIIAVQRFLWPSHLTAMQLFLFVQNSCWRIDKATGFSTKRKIYSHTNFKCGLVGWPNCLLGLSNLAQFANLFGPQYLIIHASQESVNANELVVSWCSRFFFYFPTLSGNKRFRRCGVALCNFLKSVNYSRSVNCSRTC
jgi:hypothetical protein